MSAVARVVGTIASIAAIIPGPHQPIAAGVAAVANTVAQITAPKPVARGSLTQPTILVNPPRPYMVGESYSGGFLRFEAGYGDTRRRVPNPYLARVKTFSGVGPVGGLVQELFDFRPIGSSYNGFYASASQIGLRSGASAMVPPLDSPAPGWTSSSNLFGYAAILSNYLFDRDGEVYANGIPNHGGIWRGELSYDPRLDSTRAGGDGPHRLGDESTYTYSVNTALNTGTYAYGRYENGIKIMGIGLDDDGIDWAAIAEWANDCDDNGWGCHGTITEGGDDADIERQRVRNLDDLCAAGGGRWFMSGAVMTFDWHRPRVPLATITDDDLLEDGISATALKTVRERMNGVTPIYIMPAQNWEQLPSDEIINEIWRAEDGRPLSQTWPLNLVKDNTQAGQLATYAMAETREIGPIEMSAKAEWRFYKAGDTLTLDSQLIGYTGPVVITRRDFDPTTMAVKLIVKSETAGKHPYALGQTATPPPTPLLGQTPEEKDALAHAATRPAGFDEELIRNSNVTGLTFTRTVQTSDVDVTLSAHWREYGDKTVAVNEATMTGLTPETLYYFYYDDESRKGGDVAIINTTDASIAYASSTNPDRHFVGLYRTPNILGEGGGGSGSPPPSGGPTPNLE